MVWMACSSCETYRQRHADPEIEDWLPPQGITPQCGAGSIETLGTEHGTTFEEMVMGEFVGLRPSSIRFGPEITDVVLCPLAGESALEANRNSTEPKEQS